MAGLRDNLHLITVLQLVAQGDDITIHLRTDALMSNVCVNAVGKVDGVALWEKISRRHGA